MDDTPKGLLRELRSSILRKRIGQIALAVLLAEAALQFLNSLTWYLIIPVIGRALRGQTESVLFEKSTESPIRWETLFGSALLLTLTVIVVIFLNRWIERGLAVARLAHSESNASGEEEVMADTTGSVK
jgi:large-conductance mechanosensitive channel